MEVGVVLLAFAIFAVHCIVFIAAIRFAEYVDGKRHREAAAMRRERNMAEGADS